MSLERDSRGFEGIDTGGGYWDHAVDSRDLFDGTGGYSDHAADSSVLLDNSPSSPSRDHAAIPGGLANGFWKASGLVMLAGGMGALWLLLPGVFRWVLHNPGPDLLVWALALLGWIAAGGLLGFIALLPVIIVGSIVYALMRVSVDIRRDKLTRKETSRGRGRSRAMGSGRRHRHRHRASGGRRK